MNKQRFLAELRRLLVFMTESDRSIALEKYTRMFDEAGEGGEAALLEKLGSPTKVAISLSRGYVAGQLTAETRQREALKKAEKAARAARVPSADDYDPGAVEGGWNEADTDKIVDALNEKVEQGMINISMNTTPIFQNGSSAGNLMIVNESVNNYPQVVEIHRNDTGEVIYKSGAIPVGSKLETAKLSADLDAGTYECTALFYNVDPDSGEYLGCAGAVITVTVLE